MWTLQRLADYMVEQTGIRVSPETIRRILARHEIVFSQPQHTVSSPDPDYAQKKHLIEQTRDQLKAGEVFYYADEFNVSWLPALRAMWSPKGQQVMIPTPGQQTTYYGIGAVNYYTGETVVHFQPHKRRQEIAHLLAALVGHAAIGLQTRLTVPESTHLQQRAGSPHCLAHRAGYGSGG